MFSKNKLPIRKIPSFKRNALQRKVPSSWRKPKGLFNKRKDLRNSKGKLVKIGYKQNKEYRGKVPLIHYQKDNPVHYEPKRLKPILVRKKEDLLRVKDKENSSIIISRKLGLKKKKEFFIFCKTNGLVIDSSQKSKMKKKIEE